jgi:hypothetical protein
VRPWRFSLGLSLLDKKEKEERKKNEGGVTLKN